MSNNKEGRLLFPSNWVLVTYGVILQANFETKGKKLANANPCSWYFTFAFCDKVDINVP